MRKLVLILSLACLLVTAVVYFPTLDYGFFVFDDMYHLSKNPHIRDFSASELWWIWTHGYEAMYIPVTYSLWGIVSSSFGVDNAFPYHFVNCVLHGLNSLLVFYWLRLMLCEIKSPQGRDEHRDTILAAWLGAALFIVHPIHVESVAWISAFKDLNSTIWALLSMIFFMRSRAKQHYSKRKRYMVLTLLFFLLGILAKPNVVVLALFFACLDFTLYRRGLQKTLISSLLFGLPALGLIYITTQLQSGSNAPEYQIFSTRFMMALDAIRHYGVKTIFPVNFSFDYERTGVTVLSSWNESIAYKIGLGAVLAGCVAGCLPRVRKLYPMVYFGLGTILVLVSPNLGFLPFLFQKISTVADRFFYLPSVGLSLLLSGYAYRVLSARHRPASDKYFIGGGVSIAVIIIASTVLSMTQVKTWSSSSTQIDNSLRHNPQSYPLHLSLAAALTGEEKWSRAIRMYKRAWKLEPQGDEPVHGIVLAILDMGGDLEHAKRYYVQAQEMGINATPMHFVQIGNLCLELKNYKDASHYLSIAARFYPESKDVAASLAYARARTQH
jgi:protein O-mannosyl-transferase